MTDHIAVPNWRNKKLWWWLGGGLLLLLALPKGRAGQVSAQRTPLSRTDATALLRAALTAALGRSPTPAELKMLVAQSDLETRGWHAMWNWNFGNATVGKTGTWFFIPGHTSHRFRSFTSAAEGSTYFVKLLQNHFQKAWTVLGSGNTTAFAKALKDQKYYEESPGETVAQSVATYAAGLSSRYTAA
jgi:hypothetical protein